jgi:exodeoxyribonuclease V alpha subunit
VAAIIGPQRAVAVIDGFGFLSDEIEVFRWLDRYGVTPRTAAAAAALWGKQAITKIEADPYSLALLESWRVVDSRALRLGLSPADDRRLLAAVDEALARRYRRGHTAATADEIALEMRPLLGPDFAAQLSAIIERSVRAGRIIRLGNGLHQGRAAWFMEREVERRLAERLARRPEAPSATAIEAAIAQVESTSKIVLTAEQRQAVLMALSRPVSALSGSAGAGKTSTVKAILAAAERLYGAFRGFRCVLVAVAGRAAKRLREATGMDAMTVARFLRRLEASKQPWRSGLLVLDEASMLDLPSTYRVLVSLPPNIDILFIGDPGQLPPIGPGLVFHRIVGSSAIPQVHLGVIHRQSEDSGIPAVADAIRNGRLPRLPSFDFDAPERPGVYLLEAATERLNEAVLGVFGALAGPVPGAGRTAALHERDIQVLCPLKNGPGGARPINREIERIYMAHQPQVRDWGLSVGGKVLWLRNDYQKSPAKDENGNPLRDEKTGEAVYAGFMNGALGILQRATEHGARVQFDDGAEDEIRLYDLENLTHGWAISVHKAQGSDFRRVIIPITKSRLLDRALIYTAITRGIDTVVLVGSAPLLRSAISFPPKAAIRRCALTFGDLV